MRVEVFVAVLSVVRTSQKVVMVMVMVDASVPVRLKAIIVGVVAVNTMYVMVIVWAFLAVPADIREEVSFLQRMVWVVAGRIETLRLGVISGAKDMPVVILDVRVIQIRTLGGLTHAAAILKFGQCFGRNVPVIQCQRHGQGTFLRG